MYKMTKENGCNEIRVIYSQPVLFWLNGTALLSVLRPGLDTCLTVDKTLLPMDELVITYLFLHSPACLAPTV